MTGYVTIDGYEYPDPWQPIALPPREADCENCWGEGEFYCSYHNAGGDPDWPCDGGVCQDCDYCEGSGIDPNYEP